VPAGLAGAPEVVDELLVAEVVEPVLWKLFELGHGVVGSGRRPPA
jgi:hypothetical protein